MLSRYCLCYRCRHSIPYLFIILWFSKMPLLFLQELLFLTSTTAFLLFPEKQLDERLEGEILPRPDRIHHVAEDFLTTWMAPRSHVQHLRHFLEWCLQIDTRSYFPNTCFTIALTKQELPVGCKEQWIQRKLI